jgi:hypothetical protein
LRIRNWHILALVVFLLLTSVYLLTYNGLFRSIDELALFSAAESLVQTGRLETPQLLFAAYHNPVGRLEPLFPLVSAPLYWLAVRWAEVGNVQVAMLINVLLTAGTGTVLLLTLRQLGYASLPATVTALAYGLTTLAWPYSRTFFREPLLALLTILAVFFYLRWRKTLRWPYALLGLAWATLSVAVKLTSSVLLLVYGLALLLALPRGRRRLVLVWGGLFLLGGALFLVVLSLRYGEVDLARLWRQAWAADGATRLLRLYGLLLSPGKGLVFYSPTLLLALPGLPALWRRERAATGFVLGLLLAYLGLYSAHELWYGGLCWGPRFLVPLIPLLTIPIAELLSSRRRWVLAGVAGFLIVSFVVQAGVSTVDWTVHYDRALAEHPQPETGVWLDPRSLPQAPVWGTLRTWGTERLDLLWAHAQPDGTLTCHTALMVSLGLSLGASLAALIWTLCGWRGTAVVSAISVVVLAVGAFSLLTQAPTATAGYPGIRIDEMRGVAELLNRSTAPRTVVTVSNEFHFYLVKNYLKGRFVHYWYSPAQREEFDALLSPPLESDRLWLTVDRVHLEQDQSGHDLEIWLMRQAYRADADWVGGYQVIRFLLPGDPPPWQEADHCWQDGIALEGYAFDPVVAPGGPLRFEFRFRRVDEIQGHYFWFVHLIAPDGRSLDGPDGEPLFGAAPTFTWAEGEVIHDRRAFYLPTGWPPGEYAIEVGFHGIDGRLPLSSGPGDALRLGTVQVVARGQLPHSGSVYGQFLVAFQ